MFGGNNGNIFTKIIQPYIRNVSQWTTDESLPTLLDEKDPLKGFRPEFIIPPSPANNGERAIYLCGNSLGLQPKRALEYIKQEFDDWAHFGVEGHFHGRRPWFHYHKNLTEHTATLVGALPSEVVVMNQLTVNLHLLLVSFYRPSKKRFKIIMEAGAFPSDMYTIQSQVEYHGFSYQDAVVEIAPEPGEYHLKTENILKTINEHADELALVFFSGVQYYTGQLFDIPVITQAAHAAGALAGFDLAHAAGNALLQLHDWQVDFAAWCSYKYLNSGPGNVSGVFIHEKHGNNCDLPRFAGWWGHKEDIRFKMEKGFIPESGAAGWQLSNAPVFGMAAHLASLEIFSRAGMNNLKEKSEQLSSYLWFWLEYAKSKNRHLDFTIITPKDQCAAQISILTHKNGKSLFEFLAKKGIICDWREPNVIRMAPVPLYNSYREMYQTGKAFFDYVAE